MKKISAISLSLFAVIFLSSLLLPGIAYAAENDASVLNLIAGFDFKSLFDTIRGNAPDQGPIAAPSTSSIPEDLIRDVYPKIESDPFLGGILHRINEWFRSITGIGIDDLFLAFWRLLIWFIRVIFRIIEFLAQGLLDLIRNIL